MLRVVDGRTCYNYGRELLFVATGESSLTIQIYQIGLQLIMMTTSKKAIKFSSNLVELNQLRIKSSCVFDTDALTCKKVLSEF